MPESVKVSALILAGGASTRFGRPKASIELAGRPLISHVAHVLEPLADEIIVSVADPQIEGAIRSFLPNVVFARDDRPGSGPIEGFRQGFRAARGEVLLVAPCDAPLLRLQVYQLLLEVLGDYDAAVPKLNAVDPVRAVYRRARVLEVLDADSHVPSPSALVDRLLARFVGADQIREVDPGLASFLDVNTPEELRQMLQRMHSTTDRRRRPDLG